MKTATSYLGFAIQTLLHQQGASVDILAQQLQLHPDSLSNLIHGRRQFKDPLLVKLANTPLFRKANFSLQKLRALRAMDTYSLEEIMLALLEYLRQGAHTTLQEDCFERLRQELALGGFPAELADKQTTLLALIH